MASVHQTFVLSDEFVDVFSIINSATFDVLICSFGIVTNIINIIVFIKNGFTDTVNISLLSLAVSDLLCLLSLQWMNVSLNPLFVSSDVPWVIVDVVYLTGGCTHATFARITSWITAFVSLERCMCFLAPLHIKRIITASVTTTVMIIIYILMIISHFPDYLSLYLGWRFHEISNKTLVGIIPRQNRDQVESLAFIFSVLSQLVSFLAVIVFTIVLIAQMRQTSQWRKSVMSEAAVRSSNHQKRSDRMVKTILVVAITYIVCFFPSIVVYTCSIMVPELSITGRYSNSFRVAWDAAFTFETVNSSSSFCVYYVMSSKFRVTCHQMNPFRNKKTT